LDYDSKSMAIKSLRLCLVIAVLSIITLTGEKMTGKEYGQIFPSSHTFSSQEASMFSSSILQYKEGESTYHPANRIFDGFLHYYPLKSLKTSSFFLQFHPEEIQKTSVSYRFFMIQSQFFSPLLIAGNNNNQSPYLQESKNSPGDVTARTDSHSANQPDHPHMEDAPYSPYKNISTNTSPISLEELQDSMRKKFKRQIPYREQLEIKMARIMLQKHPKTGFTAHSNNNNAADKLPWPLTGDLLESYHYDPLDPMHYLNNPGISIAAVEGQEVMSVEKGEIVYADWLQGYGNIVIIYHNGFFTLYAHLSEIITGKGETVSKGETIGLAGATDSLKGPLLHFEIRRDGTPRNPLHWLKPDRK